jgi:hypoxanthine phosphoribosyltransferase
MFCDFTDDDRCDAWKTLVASAIGGMLVAGLLSAILWLQ